MKNTTLKIRLSAKEKEIIESNAKACSMTTSAYMRKVSISYDVKSTMDQQNILSLLKINADLGRLGGLLKYYITERKTLQKRNNKEQYAQLASIQGEESQESTVYKNIDNTINKYGDLVYIIDDKEIIDKDKKLHLAEDIDQKLIKTALIIAKAKYGDQLEINGSKAFKSAIIQIVTESKMNITFKDVQMEEQRKKILLKIGKNVEELSKLKNLKQSQT